MVMDLILRSEIIAKDVNKSVEISVVFNHMSDLSEDKDVMHTWKFDIKKKDDIHYWFASETEEVKKKLFSIKIIWSGIVTTNRS